MSDLDADGRGRIGTYGIEHGLVGGFLLLIPEAEILRGYAPRRFYCRSFHNEQPGSGNGKSAVVHGMPVHGAALICRVLIHGGDDNSVGQRQPFEFDGREEWIHGVLLLGFNPSGMLFLC